MGSGGVQRSISRNPALGDLEHRGSSEGIAIALTANLAIRFLLNPALPLALWFVFEGSIGLVHLWTGIQRPAVLLLGYLAVCLISARARTTAGARFTFEDAIVAGLLTWIGASALHNGADMQGFARHAVALSAAPWLASRFLNPTEIRDFIKYAIVLALLLLVPTLVYTLASHQSLERVYLLPDWVLMGLVGLPIAVAVVACAAIILRLDRDAEPLIPEAICWTCIGPALAVVVYTGARAWTISLVLVLCGLCAFARWQPPRRRLLLLSYAIASITIALLVLPEARKEHFSELTFLSDSLTRLSGIDPMKDCTIKQDSIAIRLFLAKEAFEQMASAPILGTGFGRFGYESCFYAHRIPFASPHSTLLHVAAELGVPGLALMVTLLIAFARRIAASIASRVASEAPWILMAVWMLCVLWDQFSGSYLAMPHFYIVSALLLTTLQARSASPQCA